VLIFNSVFYPTKIGGAEKSVFNLAAALIALGHNVGVVSIDEKTNKTRTEVLDNGVVCFYLKDLNLYWPFNNEIKVSTVKKIFQKILELNNFRYKKQLNNIFNEFSPDVVHTNNLKGISTIVWRIAKSKNCRVVHTLRDYYLQCHNCSKRKHNTNCVNSCALCEIYSTPKKRLSKAVDHVVGISRFILESHTVDGFFPNSKASVIYNSIGAEGDFNTLLPNSDILDIKQITFGYLGRVSLDKGVKALLDRFSEMNVDATAKLLLAGNGDKEIVKQLEETDGVDYRGYMNPIDFFNEIDFLIVPSLWFEPMGRVVIEAYSNGVPVIVNGVGGLTELVTQNETGIITDITKSTKFQEDISTLLSLDYKKMCEACLKRSNDFTDEIMTNLYLDAYKGEL
jgi:glycosyltransferase involved in cell wall biosynthesis